MRRHSSIPAPDPREQRKNVYGSIYRLGLCGRECWAVYADGVMVTNPTTYGHALEAFKAVTLTD